MTARVADARRRSCASIPDAEEIGIRRAIIHFSSMLVVLLKGRAPLVCLQGF